MTYLGLRKKASRSAEEKKPLQNEGAFSNQKADKLCYAFLYGRLIISSNLAKLYF